MEAEQGRKRRLEAEKRHIKQEKKTLEYFERMLPSYDEYERKVFEEL